MLDNFDKFSLSNFIDIYLYMVTSHELKLSSKTSKTVLFMQEHLQGVGPGEELSQHL